MWWLLYVAMSFILGYWITTFFLSDLHKISGNKISYWLVMGPTSFIIGTLILTSVTYILAYAMSWTGIPLLWGNILVFCLMVTLSGYKLYMKKQQADKSLPVLVGVYCRSIIPARPEIKAFFKNSDSWLAIAALVFASFLMVHTLTMQDDTVLVGGSVYGDMNAHIAVTRSFSEGQNIPTTYPFYAADNIRYHFMYYFLTGNLEYLGLPLDWAINLPSILSLASLLVLLYVLAVALTGYRAAGVITIILFIFRSSFAFYTFLLDQMPVSISGLVQAIMTNSRFIGSTPNESWGMWNLNVYVNQRHFSFVIALLLVILLSLITTLRSKKSSGGKSVN